ncbi:MAG TPA: ferredoxin [Longimicrobiales bacterium]|nr:ferredoxin [Longimicrobiales bacterium]
MDDVVERRIGSLTLRIDRLLCVGFGDCIEAAAELFELDDEGIAAFRQPLPVLGRERLEEACRSCPVDALTLVDEEGRQLAP